VAVLRDLKPEGTSDALALFLRDVGRVRLLSAGEEVELAKRIWRGDLDAKAKMVESNLRLVVSIAEVTGVDPGGSSRCSSCATASPASTRAHSTSSRAR
jgi:hypothetical protein